MNNLFHFRGRERKAGDSQASSCTGSGLVGEYHVAAFYDLLNTRELNTAACCGVYDMV